MALLEVAGAFMNLKKKPLRTIIFAWVNGEEKGLLGSEYYASNPVIPMEKTVANINLDMIGRSRMVSDTGKIYGFAPDVTSEDQIMMYTAHESSELLKIVYASAGKSGIEVLDKGKDHPFGTSDHASFQAKKVPALFFHSGVHADLHATGDDIEKIDFDKMEKVSRMVFLLGYEVANKRVGLKLDKQ
jgi:Zn-dependent M28 family amino/carboxypeptidase